MIVLDTDVSFATDIAELWKMFSFLNGLKVGFVWYNRKSSVFEICMLGVSKQYWNNCTPKIQREREREGNDNAFEFDFGKKQISLFHLAFLSRFKNWEIYLTCMKWVIHIFSHFIKVLGLVENQSDWYLGKIWKNHIPWPALVCPISLSCSIVISFVFVVLFWYLCSIWL